MATNTSTFDLLSAVVRNEWIYQDPLKAYIRKSKIPFDISPSLHIASVDVDRDYQRQGYFKNFLRDVEAYAKQNNFKSVYVENIINENLESFLIQQNYSLYKRESHAEYPPCYFKLIEQ